jgi:hypothetical protein
VVLTETSVAPAFTVQTQTTKPAVLAGLTSAELDADWTSTHSCALEVDLLGDGLGLGLGLGVFVGVGDGDGLGLGLELSVPLLDVDGEGLADVLDGEGELDPVALALAESLGDGLELSEDVLALAESVPVGVVLGESESRTLDVANSVAPTVWVEAAALLFAAGAFFSV